MSLPGKRLSWIYKPPLLFYHRWKPIFSPNFLKFSYLSYFERVTYFNDLFLRDFYNHFEMVCIVSTLKQFYSFIPKKYEFYTDNRNIAPTTSYWVIYQTFAQGVAPKINTPVVKCARTTKCGCIAPTLVSYIIIDYWVPLSDFCTQCRHCGLDWCLVLYTLVWYTMYLSLTIYISMLYIDNCSNHNIDWLFIVILVWINIITVWMCQSVV